jgi:hypothetical protein
MVALPAEDGRPQGCLEFVEKLLTTELEFVDMTERNAMACFALRPVPS